MTLTNTDSRQTLKTSFINNTQFTYDQAVAIDYVNLVAGSTVIDCAEMNYTTSAYIVMKLDSTELSFTAADHVGIITNNSGTVRITLPIIDSVQQIVPFTGLWRISLCNNREAQRQSLSKALRPKADL
jgi:phage baseplate assembly protein gpV